MATREKRHVPRYHFVAPEGPCSPFDPNGALYWRMLKHLGLPAAPGNGHLLSTLG